MKYICHKCIGETLVSSEIKNAQPRRICDYCGSKRPAISIPHLAQRVDPVFQNIVGEAEMGFVVRDGNPDWAPNGDYPSVLMTEILEADDEEIARDLVRELARRHQFDVHDGGFDYYDDTSDTYTILDARDDWFGRGWASFCDELKHQRRFFLDRSAEVLEEIFGPVLRGEWPPEGALRMIGPDTDNRYVYRARPANERSAQEAIYRERKRQLGAPAPGIAGSGRMNAAGISVFYGSFDPDTCVAELRTPVGGFAIVGRFEVLRPLRVLDLTRLEGASESVSYFDENYSERMAYSAFMRGFHAEVRRAIIPGREALDYLPTQVIAEYLWSQDQTPIDGLVFGSAQLTGSSNNVVLFPHAASVEGADDEAERRTAHFYYRRGRTDEDADDEEREDRDVVSFSPADPGAGDPGGRQPMAEDGWLASLFQEPQAVEPLGPALRLGDNDIWRVRVDGISYVTHSIHAEFREQQAEPDF
jgi:hypothetical protein